MGTRLMSEHLKDLSFAAAGIIVCVLFTTIQELILGQAIIIKSLTASLLFGTALGLLLQRYVPRCLPSLLPEKHQRDRRAG